MTYPKPNEYGIDDTALAQRIAELSDNDFAALVSQTRPHMPTEAEQRRAEGRANASRLLGLRAESDANAEGRAHTSLAGTHTDQAAAAATAQEAALQAAAAQAADAPQGFAPNRGQGAGTAPPPAAPQTGQQKAGELHTLHQQQRPNGA